MIDYGLVFIASLVLRTLVIDSTSEATLVLVFILSFAVTMIQLTFKIVDTSYDMLIAMVFPIFKFLPFALSMRDSLNTSTEFKSLLMSDPWSG